MNTPTQQFPSFGYLVQVEIQPNINSPLAWFVQADEAYDWKARNQGRYLPLSVTPCRNLQPQAKDIPADVDMSKAPANCTGYKRNPDGSISWITEEEPRVLMMPD